MFRCCCSKPGTPNLPLSAEAPVYQSHHFDSTKWQGVNPRPDDIIIATAYKSGTTWMQQIVSELLFQGKAKPASVADMSPWVDLRVPPIEEQGPVLEAQSWRRFLKTHLPADAFEPYFNKSAKYIYVGRDGRDAFMSMLNHWEKANDILYATVNESPGRVGPPIPNYAEWGSVPEIFDRWLMEGWPSLPNESDGWPLWSLFHNNASWWEKGQANSNILFVHFNDLKADLQGEMLRIARFLEVEVDEELLPDLVNACTFEEMKKNANRESPLNGTLWKNGGNDFIFKGTNQRWKGVLSDEQVAAYEEKANRVLPPKCAKWLQEGSGASA
ncbi:unnamed protein product [Polarella glacialis]|uniref:Sulfotransferase domain-containing protein n=1 Tax=Polarella glacialis TaxID=89957 RepID=A0A813DFR2_POLGL|nr:unnamed protein product [Polarella glacialis]